MMKPPHSWPRRFMAALPPISDRLMVVGLMVMLVVLGIILGWVWCGKPTTIEPSRGGLQERVQALEERVKMLEERSHGTR